MTIAGISVKLCMDTVSEKTLRISVLPSEESVKEVFSNLDLDSRVWGESPIAIKRSDKVSLGKFTASVKEFPFRVDIAHDGNPLQSLEFCEKSGKVSFDIGNGPLFGLGHGYKTRFDRRGEYFDLRVNGQVPGIMENYSATSPTPYVISTEGWSLFFHQPWKGAIDLSGDKGTFEKYPAAYCDVFITACEEPLDSAKEYYAYTGLPPMPPKYAFGFQQSYRTLLHNNRNYVIETAKWMRENEIPCDLLIYLGTGYCDNGWNTYNGEFEFHPDVFPNPEQTMQELHDMNYNIMLHVTRCFTGLHGSVNDENVNPLVYDHAKNYWKRHENEIYAIAKNMTWWPDDADEVDMEARLARHRMYYEGSLKLNPDIRPFQMQRNTFPGANKWGGIIWSGDVNCEWETLKQQVPIGLNVALSSSSYWGTDTGGFFSTAEFDAELFIRWVEYSTFTPMMRFHGRPSFLHTPWGWTFFSSLDEMPLELNPNIPRDGPPSAVLPDERVAPLCKKFINLRYKLLPYLYTLSWETSKGIPMMRPLWCYWENDEKAVSVDTQYMLGENLMVAPVTAKGATDWEVYLPEGDWYDYWSKEKLEGKQTITASAPLDIIPLYVRAGGIIATAPVVQYVDNSPKQDFDPLILEVYTGADGEYILYEDDGISMSYLHGESTITRFKWDDEAKVISASGVSTIFAGKSREITVRILPEGVKKHLLVKY